MWDVWDISEEEAKKKIYNVSCERYFGFGCEIDEETSNKLEGLYILLSFPPFFSLICFSCIIYVVLYVLQVCLAFFLSFLILMLMPRTRIMEVSLVYTSFHLYQGNLHVFTFVSCYYLTCVDYLSSCQLLKNERTHKNH